MLTNGVCRSKEGNAQYAIMRLMRKDMTSFAIYVSKINNLKDNENLNYLLKIVGNIAKPGSSQKKFFFNS